MYLSVRPNTTGLAAASVAIITLGLVSAPPPVTSAALSRVEVHAVQLAAAVVAQVGTIVVNRVPAVPAKGQPPSPPHTAAAISPSASPVAHSAATRGANKAAAASTTPIYVSIGGFNILAYFTLAAFASVADLFALIFHLPFIPFVMANPFATAYAAARVPGTTASKPSASSARRVAKPNTGVTRADAVTPKTVAVKPITAARAHPTTGVIHAKAASPTRVVSSHHRTNPAAAGVGHSNQ
jgi:hypothetical protein